MSVNITVNGQQHEVEAGRWLIDVLNDLGLEIPHFCYHPGLGPDGNCRMCQVEYVTDRGSRLAISCNQQVTDGLNIVTNSERVKQARAAVEEFLLLNHPLDCPICDKAGECTLQNYYMKHDLKNTRQEFIRFKKRKALDIGPTMVLDQERCVLCDRCVRFLRDWAGDEQLYIAGRGHESFLTPFPGKPVDSPYSLNTVDLCPVGALTSKDFRFAIPTWFLKRTPSVCTTCSRGCSIFIDSRNQTVHRLRPRHNPHVNGYWMCDEGRLNYKFVNTDRIKTASVKRGGDTFETSLENGMEAARNLLGIGHGEGSNGGSSGRPAVLVVLASATCTLEEMFLLKTFAAGYKGAVAYVARHVPDGVEDDLLRRSDRHPNVKGAELLGMALADFRDGAEGKADGGIRGDIPDGAALLAVGFDYGIDAALEEFFKKFAKIVTIASRQSTLTSMANVVLPGLTFAEREGLIVNFEGHVQSLTPALDNLWDRTPPWELVAELLSAATGAHRIDTIAKIRTALGSEEPAFSGINLNAVGDTGVRLEAQKV
jgi:NADH-quinone oxidoreductase subunit G